MKKTVALALVAAAALAGCSRPVVKETIIERPVFVDRAAMGATAPACTYASQSFSHGAISCQDRTQYRCENGIWNRTNTLC